MSNVRQPRSAEMEAVYADLRRAAALHRMDFTRDEDQALRRHWAAGASVCWIAVEMDRSQHAVASRLRALRCFSMFGRNPPRRMVAADHPRFLTRHSKQSRDQDQSSGDDEKSSPDHASKGGDHGQ